MMGFNGYTSSISVEWAVGNLRNAEKPKAEVSSRFLKQKVNVIEESTQKAVVKET